MRTLPLAPSLLAASLVFAACQGTAPPAAPEVCAKIGGAAEVLTPGRIVLLGEMHGTEEGPAFLANLACAGLEAGRAVTVGVEIPKEEEKRIRAFLASDGGPAARAALVQGPFWDGEWKDGRSSEAMVALLDRVRVWKGQRRPVAVALLDREDAPGAPTRDESMAAAVEKAAKAEPQGVVVALTGNIHNRTKVGAPWDAAYEPMGYLASQTLADRLVSLDFASAGGTAWNCQQTPEDCGVKPLRARREGAGPEVLLHPEPDQYGYHGLFFVGPATASPPAVPRKGGARR